jgi:hypothetical protein
MERQLRAWQRPPSPLRRLGLDLLTLAVQDFHIMSETHVAEMGEQRLPVMLTFPTPMMAKPPYPAVSKRSNLLSLPFEIEPVVQDQSPDRPLECSLVKLPCSTL